MNITPAHPHYANADDSPLNRLHNSCERKWRKPGPVRSHCAELVVVGQWTGCGSCGSNVVLVLVVVGSGETRVEAECDREFLS